MTLAATNDRYINDAAVAQAVAQYLSRIGIKTEVNAMTRSVFFPQRAKREFSFAMGGWGSGYGRGFVFPDLLGDLRWTRSRGWAPSNYGGYSDPAVRQGLRAGHHDGRPGAAQSCCRQSVRRALDQLPSIPLHFESSAWAFRADIGYEGRADQLTLAASAWPAH